MEGGYPVLSPEPMSPAPGVEGPKRAGYYEQQNPQILGEGAGLSTPVAGRLAAWGSPEMHPLLSTALSLLLSLSPGAQDGVLSEQGLGPHYSCRDTPVGSSW